MKIIDTYSTKGDSIEILLRQIGATKITKVKGYLYFIKFNNIHKKSVFCIYYSHN